MAIDAVRSAIMARLAAALPLLNVPEPPPAQISDKTIIVYPQPGDAIPAMHRGDQGGVVIGARDIFIVEYHRRIPEKEFGSVIGDVTAMTETVRTLVWAEFAPGGGKFGGAADLLHRVGTDRFGELGWNEFTFGCRLSLELTHYTQVAA